jgi:signal transduction histidine kinase
MADQLGLLSEITNLRRQIESTAVQKERRRLARDLHDSVTQSLHSLVLAADTATHRLKQRRLEKLEASLEQLSEAARQALKEMRLLLFELRLAPKSEVDLIEMIQARLETVEKRAGVEGTLEHEPEAQWPRGWNDELYPIMMESMNNSLKHARATRLQVRITTSQTPRSIRFEVIDNGVGFSLDQLPPGGMGIISIKERAERLGAQLNIDSSPGQGTTVRVTVPI